jgi:broad specificity polyphosphatase/5'/3'-nucleotidase SurE
MEDFLLTFIDHTVSNQVNDLRLLPIVIPTEYQRKEMEALVGEAIQIQKQRYVTKDEEEKSNLWQNLQEVQKHIDKKVEEIYKA